MRSNKIIIRVIQQKKQVYYPLFTLSVSYLLCWLIILFVNYADSQVDLPFFFWSIAILIFIYSLDLYNVSKSNDDSVSKKLIVLLLIISLVINFIVILRLIILVFFNIYYLISICIYLFISVLVFFVLHREVIKYYLKKNKQIIE